MTALASVVQKFFTFESDLNSYTNMIIIGRLLGENDLSDGLSAFDALRKDVDTKLEDLVEFYKTNRHLISVSSNEVLSEILDEYRQMHTTVELIANSPKIETLPDEFTDVLPSVPENFDWRDPNKLLAWMVIKMEAYSNQLDGVYKSESGI